MRSVGSYGLHYDGGIAWLVQNERQNLNAIGLPPEEKFKVDLPIHPISLRSSPHKYDLDLPAPSTKDLRRFMQYVEEDPILPYLLPIHRDVGTGLLIRCDYEPSRILYQAVRLLGELHFMQEPWIYPMSYFEQAHRNLHVDAERTNLAPLVVSGISWRHIKTMSKFGNSLFLCPRTVILMGPRAVLSREFFVMMEPKVLVTPEFVQFLESVRLPLIGSHILKTHMRGEKL